MKRLHAPRPFDTKLAFVLSFVFIGVPSCRLGSPTRDLTAATPPEVKREPSVNLVPKEALTPPCGLPEVLKRPEWPTKLTSTLEQELEPAPEGTVTFVLLPDTQYYTFCRYPHLKNQANFIAQERERRHLLGAISLGDLTDHNTADEWEFVRTSLSPIAPDFPLLLTTGNHDNGNLGAADSRDTLLSTYFSEPWANESGKLRAVMTKGSIENAFYSFSAGNYHLGVLMLEWSPRRKTVEWANQVLTRYKDHRVIIATHAYVYDDSTRYDSTTRQLTQRWNPLDYGTNQGALAEDGNHDGEMLWNALVRRHRGIFLVVSGHVLGQGTGYLTSYGDGGNVVHQILVNYQMLDEGGLGYLRLIEFYPDGKTLHMKTVSPSLGLYSYAAGQDYRLEVSPPLFKTETTQLPLTPKRRTN